MPQITTRQIIAIVVAAVLWLFIYIPLIIYHGIRYYESRNHIVYRARYSNITIYEIVFLTLKLIYAMFDNTMKLILGHESLIVALVNSINTFLAYFVLYSFVWRFWCISYEIMWTKYVVDNEWKKIINPKYRKNVHNKENWYLMHKHTFGNYKWVKWRLFIIAIISSLTYIAGTSFHSSIYEISDNIYLTQIYSSWPYTMPLILLIIIYYKTPSILDNFYVQQEMKYIFIVLCIDYCSFYGFRIFVAIFVDELNSVTISILLSIAYHFVIGAQFGAVMISTAYVNSKVNHIIKSNQYKTKEIILDDNSSLLPRDISEYTELSVNLIEIQPQKQKKRKAHKLISRDLTQLLAHSVAFQSFMNHLCDEFAMENLLFVIESLQFQKYVAEEINFYNIDNKNRKRLLCEVLVLPSEIPLSAIVYDDDIDLKNKAFLLYEKYISNDSIYSINISYRVRQTLSDLIDNYDSWICNDTINEIELMNLFDEPCREIKQLMNDSYQRFKTTSQYQQLVNQLVFLQ